MWKMIALALALAIGGGNAVAQTKKELVAKLLQVQQPGIDNIGRALAGQPSQRALQAAGQAMERVPVDKREAVGKEIQADVKKFYDEIEPMLRKRAAELAPATLAPVYEEKFSEDELKAIIAWIESPARPSGSQSVSGWLRTSEEFRVSGSGLRVIRSQNAKLVTGLC